MILCIYRMLLELNYHLLAVLILHKFIKYYNLCQYFRHKNYYSSATSALERGDHWSRGITASEQITGEPLSSALKRE